MAAVGPLSYSSYRTYLECPLRWKFLYVDRLPETPRGYFTFGRVVHSVLEELLRPLVAPAARRAGATESQRTLDEWEARPRDAGGPAMTRRAMLALYDRLWSSDGYVSPEEEGRYHALGQDLLGRYYDRLVEEAPRPVAVEEHLEARWDGIPIHGYIDRIDRAPSGGLEVLDYKTSRDLSPEDARDSEQLSLYQVLVERNYTEPVAGLTLYHLRSLTPLRVPPRDGPSLTGLYDRLGTVSDGIRAQAYEPTPGRHCSRCDFRSLCPEFRTVPAADQARLRELVDRLDRLRGDQDRLDFELRDAAEALHRAAEELGVHRLSGSHAVAVRRREETWQYSLEGIRPALEASGLASRLPTGRPEEVRRLVRDASIEPELRRRVAETGSRQVRWYWDLEGASGEAGR
ncbi:MAG TPA: PD-(D/E)XK nuclease family protein [Thermoplasmata archaeon]|nr:PD-(D/E)XK nuclease family protein [Thermoplasmata archaeon]